MYDCSMTYTVVLSNPTALYGERKKLVAHYQLSEAPEDYTQIFNLS